MKSRIPVADVRDQFDYDPETGELLRKRLRAANMRPEAGSTNRDGYLVTGINGRHELVHRLAWVCFHGAWPEKQVEHVNGDKADNRIANLRLRNPQTKASVLTIERVREVVDYVPETGKFTWRVSTRATKIGDEVGSLQKFGGYRTVMIDGHANYAHRLAWFYMYAKWPERQIDHINGMRDDNRISNLRDVGVSQNSHNTKKLGPKNTTGFRGVARYMDKYIAQIMINGSRQAIGMYDTPEAASAAYQKKYAEIFGEPSQNENSKVYPKGKQEDDSMAMYAMSEINSPSGGLH